MAKFFVGQRVRVVKIVDGDLPRDLLGKEAHVTQVDNDFPDGESMYGLDIFPLRYEHADLEHEWVIGFVSSELEPILPEGHRPGIKGTCEPLDKLLSEVRHASVE